MNTNSVSVNFVLSLQVTIRASITGKLHSLPISPDRSGFTVSPETLNFNQQTSPPVSVPKRPSVANVTGAGKVKTSLSKKQDGRHSKHNLALKNLRYTTHLKYTTMLYRQHFCSGGYSCAISLES